MAQQAIYEEMAVALKSGQQEILKLWVGQIMATAKKAVEVLGEEEVKRSAMELLNNFIAALPNGEDIEGKAYENTRKLLEKLSADLTFKGATPSETAKLVFSMKDAILPTLQTAYKTEKQLEAVSAMNRLVDKLCLFTFETFAKTREAVIKEQTRSLMEVSAPVVKVWDKVLMVPLIGMLDSARTQMVMETLLTAIEETQAKVAILDISGIPIVDSLVAKHLIRTVAAAKLMGSECIITGIRSKIAQTMIQLGVDLTGVVTKSSMADGLKIALDLTNQKIVAK